MIISQLIHEFCPPSANIDVQLKLHNLWYFYNICFHHWSTQKPFDRISDSLLLITQPGRKDSKHWRNVGKWFGKWRSSSTKASSSYKVVSCLGFKVVYAYTILLPWMGGSNIYGFHLWFEFQDQWLIPILIILYLNPILRKPWAWWKARTRKKHKHCRGTLVMWMGFHVGLSPGRWWQTLSNNMGFKSNISNI